jgi:hypothetical protein
MSVNNSSTWLFVVVFLLIGAVIVLALCLNNANATTVSAASANTEETVALQIGTKTTALAAPRAYLYVPPIGCQPDTMTKLLIDDSKFSKRFDADTDTVSYNVTGLRGGKDVRIAEHDIQIVGRSGRVYVTKGTVTMVGTGMTIEIDATDFYETSTTSGSTTTYTQGLRSEATAKVHVGVLFRRLLDTDNEETDANVDGDSGAATTWA